MSQWTCRARAIIDATLVERLESLADAAVAKFPEAADPLVRKLASAQLGRPTDLPATTVTIGSHVAYRDDRTGRTLRVRLVWPEEADISNGSVSVLTPIGVALLGLSPAHDCRWTARNGEERALVLLEVGTEGLKTEGA